MNPTSSSDPRLDALIHEDNRTVAVVYRHPAARVDVGDTAPADTAVFVDGHRDPHAQVQVTMVDPDAPGEEGVDITVRVDGTARPARTVLIDPGAGHDADDWAEARDHDANYARYPAAAAAVRAFYDAGAATEHVL